MTSIKGILYKYYLINLLDIISSLTKRIHSIHDLVYDIFFQLDLKLNSETGGDLSTFIPNGEWEVIGEINYCSFKIRVNMC